MSQFEFAAPFFSGGADRRPERGHFDLLYELLNQHDGLVLSVLMAGLIARRART